MSNRESELIKIAQEGIDQDEANDAMRDLRKYYDATYMWCLDCDGVVIKEKNCCLNKPVSDIELDDLPF